MSFLMLLLSPCCPMMFLTVLGLYFSTHSCWNAGSDAVAAVGGSRILDDVEGVGSSLSLGVSSFIFFFSGEATRSCWRIICCCCPVWTSSLSTRDDADFAAASRFLPGEEGMNSSFFKGLLLGCGGVFDFSGDFFFFFRRCVVGVGTADISESVFLFPLPLAAAT